jgi:hypothetical protein
VQSNLVIGVTKSDNTSKLVSIAMSEMYGDQSTEQHSQGCQRRLRLLKATARSGLIVERSGLERNPTQVA